MCKQCRNVALLIAYLLCVYLYGLGQTQPTLIGVLEDNPGHYAGDPHYHDVRVVFRRDSAGWVAFPSNCPDQNCLKTIATKFPAQVKWTIAFDGKTLGRVTGQTPSSFDFYSTVGQQQIINASAVPTTGGRSDSFAGFLGDPVYRPLVANSAPNYHDPENWKPTQLAPEFITAVRTSFRTRFPKVKNCTAQDIEHDRPWDYPDEAVAVKRAYASNRKWLLVEVQLGGYECDGPSDEPFSPQWFVITPERQVRFLDSNMWLVDAGDYDNDGKSEQIFSIDDYNRGGYKLFYDDFNRKAVFEFSYH